ncbi:hypothetical protein ACFQS7_08635 [Dankookia sp. GCM10030260]
MRRAVALLLLLALGACAAGGASGPYLGGSVGGNLRADTRGR